MAVCVAPTTQVSRNTLHGGLTRTFLEMSPTQCRRCRPRQVRLDRLHAMHGGGLQDDAITEEREGKKNWIMCKLI